MRFIQKRIKIRVKKKKQLLVILIQFFKRSGDDFAGYKKSVLGIPNLPIFGKTSYQYPMLGKK